MIPRDKMSGLEITNTPFLATTALEEYWDLSRPLLFLGDWCRRPSRRRVWEAVGGEVLETPWRDPERLQAANELVTQLYERLLPELAAALNGLHQERHDLRYWRIVAGWWLQQYVAVLYDRWTLIEEALRRHPRLDTIVLAPESWITPADTMQFVQLIKDDPYNLQLFSRILLARGGEYRQRAMDLDAAPFFAHGSSRAKGAIVRTMRGVTRTFCGAGGIVLRSSYFSPAFELTLLARTGAVWPLPGGLSTPPRLPYDSSLRAKLRLSAGASDFERLLAQLLPFDIPSSFVETYAAIGAEAEKTYPRKAKAIFSADAWYHDEPFKRWAASASERGALLLGTQHGGGYGMQRWFPIERHELAVTDVYYSWGWTPGDGNDARAKVVPLGAAKLSGRPRLGASNGPHGIVLVMTIWMRYLHQFHVPPHQFSAYLETQPRFIRAIAPRLREQLRVRLHREDMGWDVATRLKESFPDLALESWKVSFEESMRRGRLVVCDHASTTFLEVLAADKPAILYWPREMFEMRAEAEPYFQALRDAGILHEDAESAAATLNGVHDDVERWWNDPGRQEARRFFCDRFARVPGDPLRTWAEVFRNIDARF